MRRRLPHYFKKPGQKIYYKILTVYNIQERKKNKYISIWSFLLAAVAILFIAALTIGIHSHKVPQQLPVTSLRTA